ncbi:MAG: nicotinate phosphoribosyltransferase [Simkaniaceae bacterium]|nr:nicotinate phosphoribosyltransferase [Simkaniaceae bacterium]
MTPLLTDLYELTMAQGYWKQRMLDWEGVFHLFFRKKPFGGEYAIMAGLEGFIEWMNHFAFSDGDLEYLEKLDLFDEEFLDYLSRMRFQCDIDAVEEGRVVFPLEPLVRVRGPLIQAQLIESALLNFINFQTLIATKASRICHAAQRREVIEFGLRRAPGPDGALSASRAAYIGGCHATSNLLAGKIFDIPVRGTMGHSWVMSFDSELEAFQKFDEAMPETCIYLVDTYDPIRGIKRAIEVAKNRGKMLGIRLDSGDLLSLSMEARKLLDEAGFFDAQIIASNELDEYAIASLIQGGAKIDAWGVGTRLVTGKDQGALDGVYKLSAVRKPGGIWSYKIKVSKETVPGILQVKRFSDRDIIYDEESGLYSEGGEDLLVPIYRKGSCIYQSPPLAEIRKRGIEERSLFSFPYPVEFEPTLIELKQELIEENRGELL